jgi:hypothetical protein
MDSNDWKKLKKENPAALVDLQQMVLTTPSVLEVLEHSLLFVGLFLFILLVL